MTAMDQNAADFMRVTPFDQGAGRPFGTPLLVSMRPGKSLASMLLRLLGGCMVLSAAGIWLVPGAGEDPELALLRIGVSVAFVFLGLVLLLSRESRVETEIKFDARRAELRIERILPNGCSRLLLRRGYASLGAAKVTGRSVILLEHDGRVLIELPLEGRTQRRMVCAQLGAFLPLLP
ncbi:hypothetical protein HCZ87_07825 [Phaeobacter sp. HF9A]|nr:hypothetical protein [Phaeobacter sp. HF9A]